MKHSMQHFDSFPVMRVFALWLWLAFFVWVRAGGAVGAETMPGPPDPHALSEYSINLGSKYGVSHGSSVSHETLQAIMTGAGKGNRGEWVNSTKKS